MTDPDDKKKAATAVENARGRKELAVASWSTSEGKRAEALPTEPPRR